MPAPAVAAGACPAPPPAAGYPGRRSCSNSIWMGLYPARSVFVAARTIPQVQRNCYSADRTNSRGKMPLPVVKTEAPVQWPTAVIENGAVIFSGNFSQKFYSRMFSSLVRIAIYLPAALRNLLPQDIQSFPPYQFVPHKLIPPHSILSVISSACMGAAS